ncbi:hypothetical protein KOR42_40690 [Thalassoglobus neptunius]|uniref:Uncharacterized protein n=1 Tax=Thalassoglobus neptunius TaxID=1938619 RepID=A0A5C5WD27_9PLAN|nr:hypothetical protein [Thalassoglobus neptunius]TWT47985.1 hypothetical protein KOR42_40690 [Thalassoglobus neptunius]
MADKNEQLDELINTLKQHRDELKVKLHLAQMDARQEYDRISNNIDELNKQYEPVRSAAKESGENVLSALMLAAEEMKNGLVRVGNAISDSK